MNVRYRVELSQAERCELTAMLSKGKRAARKLKRAQILLAADAGCSDEEIARTVAVGGSIVYRTKRRFVEGNLERALSEDPRPGAERKLTGKEEALLVATACASPPERRARWTLELLADAMVKFTGHESLSGETVRRRLAENDIKPWRKDMWCIPPDRRRICRPHGRRARPLCRSTDPARPVVCFDESPVQLIGEVRQPIPAEPGQLERYDYEYRRNGTVNLFVCIDVHRPWRKVKVTERRAAEDYAQCMRELVDVHYPDAACIRVVQTTCRPLGRRSLRGIRARRSPANSAAPGVPLHPQACQLAQYGRDRDRRPPRPVPGSQDRRPQTASSAKSPPESTNATPPAPKSIGCSQPKRPAPKWGAHIRSPPKSHNHCAVLLAPVPLVETRSIDHAG